MSEKMTSFEEELAEKGRLVYKNAGTSMLPMIREDRDVIVLERCGGNDPGRFDVVLFRRPDVRGRGEYVLHRILKRDRDGNYLIAGDNCSSLEKVHPDQILARLTEVKRGNRTVRMTDLAYRIYVYLWCAPYPLRFLLVKGKAQIRLAVSQLLRKEKGM